MKAIDILDRLDLAIDNLKVRDFKTFYRLLLDDLDYIINNYENEKRALSPEEQFNYGVDFSGKVIRYFADLAIRYFKLVYDMDLKILESKQYALAVASGGYNKIDGNIYYNSFGTILGGRANVGFLHTCMHEARHKYQDDSSKSIDVLSYPPSMLLLAKESLFEPEDYNSYHRDNYSKFFFEVDAENFAFSEIHMFLDKLHSMYVELTKDNGLNRKKEKIEIDIARSIDELEIKESKSDLVDQIEGRKDISGDFKVDGAVRDRLIVIDKYIKAHPELQETFPLLSILFRGYEVKTYEEIVRDRELLRAGKSPKIQQRINDLYYYVIETDPILALTDRLEKNSGVKEYLVLHPTMVEEYKEELQAIATKYNSEILLGALNKGVAL